MKKPPTLRNKILAWTAGVCLITFTLFAASPSFNQFITSQFATSGNQVRIKDAAQMTNTLHYGDAGSGEVAMTIVGNAPQITFDSGLTEVGYIHANSTSAMAIEQASGKSIALAFYWNDIDASSGTVLMQSLGFVTNALNSSSAIDLNRQRAITNMGAGLTFTGVANTSSTRVKTSTLILNPNGSDRTLTLPANWKVSDAVRTITVTNGVIGYLTVECFGNVYTSAVYRAFY